MLVSHKHILFMIKLMLLGCCLVCSSCKMISVQNRADILDKLPKQYPISSNLIKSDHSLFWEQSFPSHSLKNDIQMLLNENFELAAARAKVEQVAALYGIAKSTLMPTLDGKGGYERLREKEDNITTNQTTITFGAGLNWELDIWGRLIARKKAAKLSLQEQQFQVEQTALELQTLLVESWIIYHGACELEQVLTEQQATNQQFLSLTKLRLAQGQGNALDVLQQQGRLLTTKRNLPAVVSQKRCAANAYAVLLGHLPDKRNIARNIVDDQWPVIKQITTLTSPKQLMIDRPDLKAAFLSLQAADHEVAASIADRLPNLSIGLSYEGSGNGLSSIGQDDMVLSFTSALLAPIFNAGRFKAKVAQRKAQVNELLALLEHAMLVALQEVEDSISCENALFDELLLLNKEIEIALETVEKAKVCYVNGQETFLAVLVALVDLQSLQKHKIVLRQKLLINRASLLKALGAKWSERL